MCEKTGSAKLATASIVNALFWSARRTVSICVAMSLYRSLATASSRMRPVSSRRGALRNSGGAKTVQQRSGERLSNVSNGCTSRCSLPQFSCTLPSDDTTVAPAPIENGIAGGSSSYVAMNSVACASLGCVLACGARCRRGSAAPKGTATSSSKITQLRRTDHWTGRAKNDDAQTMPVTVIARARKPEALEGKSTVAVTTAASHNTGSAMSTESNRARRVVTPPYIPAQAMTNTTSGTTSFDQKCRCVLGKPPGIIHHQRVAPTPCAQRITWARTVQGRRIPFLPKVAPLARTIPPSLPFPHLPPTSFLQLHQLTKSTR